MTVLVFSRVPPAVKAALVSAAEADGRTLSNYIATVLAAHTRGATRGGKK